MVAFFWFVDFVNLSKQLVQRGVIYYLLLYEPSVRHHFCVCISPFCAWRPNREAVALQSGCSFPDLFLCLYSLFIRSAILQLRHRAFCEQSGSVSSWQYIKNKLICACKLACFTKKTSSARSFGSEIVHHLRGCKRGINTSWTVLTMVVTAACAPLLWAVWALVNKLPWNRTTATFIPSMNVFMQLNVTLSTERLGPEMETST